MRAEASTLPHAWLEFTGVFQATREGKNTISPHCAARGAGAKAGIESCFGGAWKPCRSLLTPQAQLRTAAASGLARENSDLLVIVILHKLLELLNVAYRLQVLLHVW